MLCYYLPARLGNNLTFIYIRFSFWENEMMMTIIVSHLYGASLGAHMVKSLPSMWESRVGSLGQEDSLEKER